MPLSLALRHNPMWLRARREPEIGVALINLMLASWTEVPASSLPNSDEVLAMFAETSSRVWRRIREEVLSEFYLASDGRLYHRLLAEAAAKSWAYREANRARTAAATAARKQRNDDRDDSRNDSRDNDRNEGHIDTDTDKTYTKQDPPPSEESTRPRAERGSRLPKDWQPSAEDRALAVSLGLNPDLTAAKFRDYWTAAAGQNARKLDWSATWRNWCRREQSNTSSRTAPVRVDERAAEARRNADRIRELEAELRGDPPPDPHAGPVIDGDGFTLD